MMMIAAAALLGVQEVDVKGFLPLGETKVDVMEIAWPAAYYPLAERLNRAFAENPEWLMKLIRNSRPGQPLPYDPRMGLSEAEYKEFISLAPKTFLRKRFEDSWTVKEDGPGFLRVEMGPRLEMIGALRVDTRGRRVTTRYGDCAYASEIHTGPDFGFPWDGHQWKEAEEEDPDSGRPKILRWNLGRLKSSGRVLMTIRYQGFHKGALIPTLEIVLVAAGTVDATAAPAPEEELSNDEVDRLFIQAQIKVAREQEKSGKKQKAIDTLLDVLKTYPKHVEAKEAKKLLDELRK